MWTQRAEHGLKRARLHLASQAARFQRLPSHRHLRVRHHSGELEPPPSGKRWTTWLGLGKPQEEERTARAVLRISAISTLIGAGLGAVNLGLQRYVQFHPQSPLARDVDGDDRRLCHYVVPIGSTVAGLALWLAAVLTGPVAGASAAGWRCWWFGAQRQWAVTGLLSLSAGHYAQELFANEGCSPTLLAHHVVAVGVALSVQAASCFRGLLLSWGAVYEAGSLLLCLGYVGVLPRGVGHWAATVSSVAGMGLGLHGLLKRPALQRLNAAAWFNVTTLLALGLGRIREGAVNLVILAKPN